MELIANRGGGEDSGLVEAGKRKRQRQRQEKRGPEKSIDVKGAAMMINETQRNWQHVEKFGLDDKFDLSQHDTYKTRTWGAIP